MVNELFEICCDRAPDPADQARRIYAAIEAGVDVNQTDKNGVTALHHAVRFRSPIAVESLIRSGANVNQPCRRNGSTPLHRAVCQTGAPGTADRSEAAAEIVAMLLAAGADPLIANKSGKIPADYATSDMLRSLLSAKAKRG
ncbi:ankyrin repeat domain-containing protein [Rhodopirellula sallentina]|uniref:Uncharacterized protein n=1 Tax=Rhodopirellula sallentina SM41 TaxID=1263870 RepID=M5UIG2_9BACT|nr:ankyrin repeat domain-containing protein [Rhodopirellula sallentina]EMI55813.1 hypothetical protein RSSM_02737 [Rhodopirellula sallentina SM41]